MEASCPERNPATAATIPLRSGQTNNNENVESTPAMLTPLCRRSVAILSNGVAPCFEAGGRGTPIVRPPRGHVRLRDIARRPRRVEAGAVHCPSMALIAVGGLLFLALPVPRIGEDDVASALRRLHPDFASRRLGHHVFASLGPVRVVSIVGV